MAGLAETNPQIRQLLGEGEPKVFTEESRYQLKPDQAEHLLDRLAELYGQDFVTWLTGIVGESHRIELRERSDRHGFCTDLSHLERGHLTFHLVGDRQVVYIDTWTDAQRQAWRLNLAEPYDPVRAREPRGVFWSDRDGNRECQGATGTFGRARDRNLFPDADLLEITYQGDFSKTFPIHD